MNQDFARNRPSSLQDLEHVELVPEIYSERYLDENVTCYGLSLPPGEEAASAAQASFEPSEDTISQLTDMGFSLPGIVQRCISGLGKVRL